jgi:hypothetical protein
MTPREKWRARVAEGAVIVASILLAFMIDVAWESRGDRTFEADALAQLELDFEGYRERLQDHLEGTVLRAEAAQGKLTLTGP